jgi:two-component system chemotaxis response regulator CheY
MGSSLHFDEWSFLVVDDNPAALAMLRFMLLMLGVKRPFEALDGPTAKKLVRGNDLDCIITDMRMEPMNGAEFVRWVRHSNEAANPTVRILAMSAYRDPVEIEGLVGEGANGFLGKPISMSLLEQALTAVALNPTEFVEVISGPDCSRLVDNHAEEGGREDDS